MTLYYSYSGMLNHFYQCSNSSVLVNVTAIDINSDNYSIQSLRYRHLHEANGGAAFYPVGTPPTSSEGQEIVCTLLTYTSAENTSFVDMHP